MAKRTCGYWVRNYKTKHLEKFKSGAEEREKKDRFCYSECCISNVVSLLLLVLKARTV